MSQNRLTIEYNECALNTKRESTHFVVWQILKMCVGLGETLDKMWRMIRLRSYN